MNPHVFRDFFIVKISNMSKIICLLMLMFTVCCCLHAQPGKDYVPCNEMPALIHTYHADVSALDRVYIVNDSPEKTERYKLLAEDYLGKIRKLNFSNLPQGCKVDYILFKRDLIESVFQANNNAKEYIALKNGFHLLIPFILKKRLDAGEVLLMQKILR